MSGSFSVVFAPGNIKCKMHIAFSTMQAMRLLSALIYCNFRKCRVEYDVFQKSDS